MALFQQSVLTTYLAGIDEQIVDEAWEIFISHFHDPEIQQNIRNSKEEEYQDGFLTDLFVNVLGYTKYPAPGFNLRVEQKDAKGSKKSDGALLKNDKVVGVIELKGTDTTDLDKVEPQAFGYKNYHRHADYVVISNFEKLRFYIDNAVDHLEFNLFELTKEEFKILWLCLEQSNFEKGLPKTIKEASLTQNEEVTKKLYADYSAFKDAIFKSIVEHNPDYDKLRLFKKTQKLLDRFLFIFFAEDQQLLPPNSIRKIIQQWQDLRDEYDIDVTLYERFKKYFGYLNTGHKGKEHEIFPYNGGLFAVDEVLDNITIDDELLYKHALKLSRYDFASEVDVNILGHIFEHSLNEIEEITAELEGQDLDRSKTRRKKDGVYYTPKYITQYIVENTVGKLCEEKKTELEIEDEEYTPNRQKATKKKLLKKLDTYRGWLLGLTICDPACGSGAFLNQALEFLIEEHHFVDELQAKLLEESIVYPDVEASILENNLFGVDINEESVEIAKLSLWLRTAQKGRRLTSLNNNIKCGNSLIDDPDVAGDKAFNWEKEFPSVFEKGGFDVVIGNPPYVVYIKSVFGEKVVNYVNERYKYAEYNPNTYALFTDLGLNQILKTKGRLGFIIPNSWMEGKYFSKMRKELYFKNVDEIVYLKDTVFDEVVETLILLVENIEAENDSIRLSEDIIEGIYDEIEFNQDKLSAGFNPFISKENALTKRLEMNFKTLDDFAIVYRGLETRNNDKWLSEKKETERHKPILLGRDVNRYSYEYSGTFVDFIKDEMKSNANLEMYEQPKILMRRTGSNIIAATDFENQLALKNLYLIIPNNGVNIYCLVAAINSKLMNYLHTLRKSGENKAFAQFSGVYIKSFPFKNSDNKNFEFLVKKITKQKGNLNNHINQFTELILSKFDIEKLSRKLENWHELTFKQFLAELKKKKVTLSLKEEAEWMEYFNEQKAKAEELKSQIARTDSEIDAMVYELYGLSEEEIGVVEGS
ncbi:MAG: N-6 DNA methylase [Balneolaceae bacterium]|nr:N-6 DNA methylase [Balneolaceae bacterium]